MKKKKGERLNTEEENLLNQPREIRLTKCPTELNLKDINRTNLKTPINTQNNTQNNLIRKETKMGTIKNNVKLDIEDVNKTKDKFMTSIYGFKIDDSLEKTKTIFSLYNSYHPSKSIKNFVNYCSQDRLVVQDTSLTDRSYISKSK